MIVVLTGCASSLSRKNPVEFAESLAEAKTILKSNRAIEVYQKYYDLPTHKAFAQSKISSVAAYATFRGTKRLAISEALKNCNELLLKRHDEITDKISCEIVNIDNEWVSE